MALTSKITKTLTHPDEPDVTITIRKLSHYQLMMATDDREDRTVDKFKRLGESAAHLPDKATAEQKAELEKPENKYHRLTVLQHGVTAWSYDDNPKASVEDLDENTASWLFDEIIAFSIRSKDEGKASANGSATSTDQAEAVGLSN